MMTEEKAGRQSSHALPSTSPGRSIPCPQAPGCLGEGPSEVPSQPEPKLWLL